MRPRLHRYCARMVGSVIDGEDVLQDALIKAVEAFASAGAIGNPEGWLFRIAHNTALDFLRRRSRQEAIYSEAEVDMMADQLDAVTSRQIAQRRLRTFMRLNVTQRSCVILMDVLGCSLAEICAVMDSSLAAVKAALVRGRAQLKKIAEEPDDAPQPALSETERSGSPPMSHISTPGISTPSRHDLRRRQARTRQQDPHDRQGQVCGILAIILLSATGTWCPAWWRVVRRSWCSIRRAGLDRRNISCCWTGPATRSRPSGISATRLTSSTAPNTASDSTSQHC